MITTPAILPITESHFIRNPPTAVADAPSEMNTSEKPRTKATDEMSALRRAPGAGDASVVPPRISSSVTPDTNDR